MTPTTPYNLVIKWGPETRKERRDFTVSEALNDLADGLADAGRRGEGADDPSRSELFDSATPGRPSFVTIDGVRVFDKPRPCLLEAVARDTLRSHIAKRKDLVLSADQEVALTAFVGAHRVLPGRAARCKFVHAQLVTKCRLCDWNYTGVDAAKTCVHCGTSDSDSVNH